jgi:hypothetical protein
MAKRKTKLHANASPTDYTWVAVGAGLAGLTYQYSITQHANAVELVIDRGNDADNKTLFARLRKHKAEIERTFGQTLEWYNLSGVRLKRIRHVQEGGYREAGDEWPAIQSRMVDTMIKLEKSIRPWIQIMRGREPES